MTFIRLTRIVLLALLLTTLIQPLAAQDDMPGEVIASGLRNPRQMTFDAAGNLYVAEAGLSGEQRSINDDPFGASARITRIAPDGRMTPVVTGLISYRQGDSLGAHAVRVTEESIWVLLGETGDFTIPFTHALVELDINTGRVKTFVDLLTLELEQDPDGNPNEQSNPTDFTVAPDGTIFIANAGCNCLMQWSREAGLSVAAAWSFAEDNPVPTAVALDADGDLYVGFLTGFPWPEGGARIERWSNGELAETFTGLTMITSVLVAQDGTLYAVEYGVFNPGSGFESGRVVRVDADGITPVLEGLTRPYGLAQAPDGTIVVSVNAVGTSAEGAVLVVPVQ